MPEENITGPTILWRELEGKKVKSNDGKKLGRIKRISQNHFLIEQGLVRKRGFWVPKIIGDAYDGENIWLSSNEDEIHDRFLYGEDPSESLQSGSPGRQVENSQRKNDWNTFKSRRLIRTVQKHARSKVN